MTTARSTQIDLDVTPNYHCMSRCVRGAYLCGQDARTGKNYDHRKQWIIQRLTLLAEVFAIDICAYAVMSNHMHLVLHVNRERLSSWTDEDIRTRVTKVFPRIYKCYDDWDKDTQKKMNERWRAHLLSLSWFMSCLCQHIARLANIEDNCRGRFWEGRFNSRALLDDGALLTCMAYVDLNPIRAGLSTSLEGSSWTSIRQRILEITASSEEATTSNEDESVITSVNECAASTLDIQPELASFYDVSPKNKEINSIQVIPMSVLDYIQLVEWTGRQIRKDKRGAISETPSKLINALGLNSATWINSVSQFGQFSILVGSPIRMQNEATHFCRQWPRGREHARRMYRLAA